MTITITLEHSDISTTDENEFQALFFIIQTYAKLTRAQLPTDQLSKISGMMKDWADKKISENEKNEKPVVESDEKIKNSSENEIETQTEKNSVNRAEIEREIKKIALDGKESGISKKIKSLIQEYGVEKLSDVPDEKLPELLSKVKKL